MHFFHLIACTPFLDRMEPTINNYLSVVTERSARLAEFEAQESPAATESQSGVVQAANEEEQATLPNEKFQEI